MKLQTKTTEQTMVISLIGELDHHAAKDAMREINYAVEAHLPRMLQLDFSGVTFMDSSGIAVVLRAQKRAAAFGGKTEICGTSQQVRKVFEAAGIQRYINIS